MNWRLINNQNFSIKEEDENFEEKKEYLEEKYLIYFILKFKYISLYKLNIKNKIKVKSCTRNKKKLRKHKAKLF